MIISYGKSKIHINGDGCGPSITLYGEQLENVKTVKYIDAPLTENGTCKKYCLIRLGTATSEIVRLEKIWKYSEIEFNLKYKLYISLVLFILQ